MRLKQIIIFVTQVVAVIAKAWIESNTPRTPQRKSRSVKRRPQSKQ